jgi:hypothetical protein
VLSSQRVLTTTRAAHACALARTAHVVLMAARTIMKFSHVGCRILRHRHAASIAIPIRGAI